MFNFFPFDYKKALLVIFVLALPLISLNFQRAPGEAPWFMKPISFMAGSLQTGMSSLSTAVTGTASMYLNLINIKRENQTLQHDISQLKVKLSQFSEIQLENERLNRLLDFKARSPAELLSARVIATDLMNPDHSTIRINRGSLDGIKAGQAVITSDGVVGTVFNTDPQSSQVLVLTDRYCVIDAVVQRSRARGIVEGATSTTTRLKYLQRTDDVQPGDMVVTTGLDDIYPQGFPIANVLSVERKTYGISQKVLLRPLVDPFRLEEVFVVLASHNPRAVDRPKPLAPTAHATAASAAKPVPKHAPKEKKTP